MRATETQLTPRAYIVRANNPGIMTLDGTNTWVLREPGARGVVVVDPGPLDEQHLQAILDHAHRDDGRVELVLYTHWHADHTESIDRFAQLTGAPARAVDAAWCRGAPPLQQHERLQVDGLELRVLFTPGHTMDSICLLISAEGSLLSGDTVLGRGTTVIAHPDGALGPYLNSLHEIAAVIDAGEVSRILPAHGPVIEQPRAVIDFYLRHREERLQQVREALADGASTPQQVVERVYADVDRSLWAPAEWSVRAQLDYLREAEGH